MLHAPSRVRLIAGLAALLTAGSVAGASLPAAASTGHQDVLTYVALGDSYAAGQAVDCTRTASSYPMRLDALHRVDLVEDVACASATTETVVGSQLGALSSDVDLVTVSVGANDLGLAPVTAACSTDPSSTACAIAVDAATQELAALGPDLVATYAAIAAAAPNATILVTGYPLLVSSGPVASAEALLNSVIEGAVATVAATGVDIRYVPVSFKHHTIDSPNPWFVTSGANAFHPNRKGDAAIARAVAHAL